MRITSSIDYIHYEALVSVWRSSVNRGLAIVFCCMHLLTFLAMIFATFELFADKHKIKGFY